MRLGRRLLEACAVAAALLVGAYGIAQAQDKRPERVVYHFADGIDQASRGLEFIRNHLEVSPTVQIVVVGHAAGVNFMMKGAKTAKGNEYREMIEVLELQGVKFIVCDITLRERGLTRDQFIPEVSFVPSGVAEITRLQQREGYAYLRP
jgi:intracellular sulfur oxidation DsrE/DsrF family protein